MLNIKHNLTSKISILLIGAILVVLNLLGLQWFSRLDLTDDQVFTLAPSSIEMVQKLKDPVTVKVYFTDNLPAPYNANRRLLQDKLNEYRAFAGQKFQYQFISPDDEKSKKTANEAGVPPIQVQVMENDALQIKNAYMGLTVSYGGQNEVLPVVQDLSNLEYELTTAIRKLSSENLPKIGFLTGNGEPNPDEVMRFWKQGLEKSYTILQVEVDSTGQFSNKPDVLLIIAPSSPLSVSALQALDDYVMQGGKVGFFLNRINASIQTGTASILDTGLEQLLEKYGIVLQPNLVQDRQSAPISAQNGPFTMQIPYAFLPIVTQFNPHPITEGVREMLLPFVSTLDLGKAPKAIKAIPLIYSSPNSSVQKNVFNIQPNPNADPNPIYSGGPYVLGATYEGHFPSVFEANKVGTSTRLLVLGDGDFMNEGIVGQPPEGSLIFAMNAIDWLLQDQTLSSIRSKQLNPRPLDPVSDGTKGAIKWFAILFPSLLVVVLGFIRWRLRKNIWY